MATAVWLVAVWVALWGGLTWANLGGGVVVAMVVLGLFPAGPSTGGRVAPGPALRYVVWFTGQLVVATAQVVVAAVAPTGRVRPAVVRVPLRSRSALVATVVANSVSLTPGTLTVDVERIAPDGAAGTAAAPVDQVDEVEQVEQVEQDDGTAAADDEAAVDADGARLLVVHALDGADPAAVRASVLAFEARAVAAFGTVADRSALADPSDRSDPYASSDGSDASDPSDGSDASDASDASDPSDASDAPGAGGDR